MRYLIIIIFISLLLTSCGFRCKKSDYEEYPLDTELLSYFGVFKTGNYWVYENAAKTKKDSIYVTDYSRYFYEMKEPCHRNEKLTFTLKATGKDVVTKDKVCMEAERDIVYTQTCSQDSLFFNSREYFDFYLNISYRPLIVVKLNSVILNNELYNGEILQISGDNHFTGNDTLFIMSSIGIIGWQKNNDTYNVTQYLIL
jgi:hypothetical protein